MEPWAWGLKPLVSHVQLTSSAGLAPGQDAEGEPNCCSGEPQSSEGHRSWKGTGSPPAGANQEHPGQRKHGGVTSLLSSVLDNVSCMESGSHDWASRCCQAPPVPRGGATKAVRASRQLGQSPRLSSAAGGADIRTLVLGLLAQAFPLGPPRALRSSLLLPPLCGTLPLSELRWDTCVFGFLSLPPFLPLPSYQSFSSFSF